MDLANSTGDSQTGVDLAGPLARALSQQKEAFGKIETGQKKVASDVEAAGKESKQEREDLMRMMPPDLEVPEYKPPKSQNPWDNFGSPAMFLAVFGSLLTQKPLQSALDAGAGVQEAFAKNDLVAAQQHMDSFKVNTDNAIKLQNFRMDRYKAILEATNKGDAEKLAELKVEASALGDQLVASQAATHNFEEIYKIVAATERSLSNMTLGKAEVEAFMDVKKAQQAPDANTSEGQARIQEAEHNLTLLRGGAGKQEAELAKTKLVEQKAIATIDSIDKAIRTIDTDPGVVGTPGWFKGVGEAISGWFGGPDMSAARAGFNMDIDSIARQATVIMPAGQRSFKAVQSLKDDLQALQAGSSPNSAKTALQHLRATIIEITGLAQQKAQVTESGEASPGEPTDEDIEYTAKLHHMTPDDVRASMGLPPKGAPAEEEPSISSPMPKAK